MNELTKCCQQLTNLTNRIKKIKQKLINSNDVSTKIDFFMFRETVLLILSLFLRLHRFSRNFSNSNYHELLTLSLLSRMQM